jgi:hypothetical protein
MGEFTRIYGYKSNLPDEETEKETKRLVLADAINQGYTPSSDPVLTWNAATRRVKATLQVEERTQDGH